MINPKVDDLSMMTYLSQFPKGKLKPGAPLRPRLNVTRVRAYGRGIEPTGNQVGAPARFTVETFSAGKGEVEVIILNPKGKQESVSDEGTNIRASIPVIITYYMLIQIPFFHTQTIPKVQP